MIEWLQPTHIILGAIGTTLATVGGGAFWVGKISNKVKTNKENIDIMAPQIMSLVKTVTRVDERTQLILHELRRANGKS